MRDDERQRIRDELVAKGRDLAGVGTALDVLEKIQGHIALSEGPNAVRYATGTNS